MDITRLRQKRQHSKHLRHTAKPIHRVPIHLPHTGSILRQVLRRPVSLPQDRRPGVTREDLQRIREQIHTRNIGVVNVLKHVGDVLNSRLPDWVRLEVVGSREFGADQWAVWGCR